MPEPTTDSLVERDAELSALAAAAERAVAGEGQLVVVEGPAGIGKTRLLQHVRSAFAGEAGAQALAARGTELETHVAFGVVRQLLEPLVFELTDEEREELFTGAASLARAVLTVGRLPGEPSEADRYSQINGLFWLASTLAREQPLALVVDDVQWADEPSVEFLGFVARRIEGLPLLLAVATRPVKESPGHLAATLVTDPGASVLRPAPLSGPSVTALVRRSVGADAEADFASACLEATHGNPFLVSELLREVRAQRLPPTAETARRVGSLAPGGVSAVVELRLAQMPEGARPLAEAVAILGDGASAAAATQLAEIEPDAAAAAEEALVRSGILEDRQGLAFTHPVVGATVLHGISPSSRTRLHAAAAAMLRERQAEPEDLATHLLHVEPGADEETVTSLRRAAEKAERLGAPATAAAYLRRALTEPPRRESRGAVLTELGRAEARAGLAEATAHLREAIGEATESEARVRAALELARALKFGGEAVQAVDVLEALAPDLDTLPAELRELVEIEHIGLAYISQGARERLGRRIAELREPAGAPRTPLDAFVLAGLSFDAAAGGVRPAGEAADLASRALAGDLIPVDAMEGGYGMLIAGVATMWSDRLDDANRINARMLAEARRRGSLVVRTAAGSMQALVSWRLGRLADAEAEAAMALELGEKAHGIDALLTAARAVKALVALRRAADDDELVTIESEVLEHGADPDALPYHLVLHARGLVRVARGDLERGIDALLECGRISVAWGSGNPTTVPWRSDAALAIARTGDRDEAVRLASEELELAEGFGALRAVGLAQRALALVAADETTVPQLEAAVETLSSSPSPLDLAIALTDLAAAERRAGRRARARERAARAQELATSCGATMLAARALDEAVAAGARPRRVALRGVDSLTPSELRVAQRAAAGNTNREIAEDLFVTIKTVEMHLANGYGKLGIRSRTQLPQALGTDVDEPQALAR